MASKAPRGECSNRRATHDRLIVGACGDLREIPDGSIDLILTDPPYGTTGCSWDRTPDWPALLESFDRTLKPNGQAAVFGTVVSLSELLAADWEAKRFAARFEMAWIKNQGMYFSAKKPIRRHESILVLAKRSARAKDLTFNAEEVKTPGKPYRSMERRRTHGWSKQIGRPYLKENADGRRWPISCLEAKVVGGSSPEYLGHPTQKPLQLLEWPILALTDPGQRILDPFAGVGSGWEAARRLGRSWIGYEIEPRFARIAQRRIQSFDKARKAP